MYDDLTDNLFVPGSITQKTVSKRVSYVRFISWIPPLFSALFLLFAFLRGINFKPEKKIIYSSETTNYYISNRGIIFDSTGTQISKNIQSYKLVIDPINFTNNKDEQKIILDILSKKFEISEKGLENVKKKLSLNHAEKIVVKKSISQEVFLKERSKIKNIEGVFFESSSLREYDFKNLFSHIVGYVGAPSDENLEKYKFVTDLIEGKSGLEYTYNEILNPTLGIKNEEGDVFEESLNGQNLFLTINHKFQESVRKSLLKGIKSSKKEKGVAIVMNPQNGKVLAMVSLPDFSLEYFSQTSQNDEKLQEIFNDKNSPQLNRAISGLYPPGSTFKPIVAVAGLSEGVITAQKIFNDTGSIKVDDKIFYGWNRSGLGKIDLKQALAQSSNPYFYTVAGGILSQGHEFDGLGYDRLKGFLQKFFIDKKTGIDLPFEFEGFIPTPEWKQEIFDEKWFSGDTVQMGIGQGFILISPLRLAVSISAIVNGGNIVEPFVVEKITDSRSNLVSQKDPKKIKIDSINSQNLSFVMEGMKEAVYGKRGTAKILSSLPFEVGAKTGTAESPPNDPHAWGVAFGPYENPEILVVVLVENGGEGNKVAIPIIKEIMESWWNMKNLGENL